MDEEHDLRVGVEGPVDQDRPVGVGGQSLDPVDGGPDRNHRPQHLDPRRPVLDLPAQGPLGLVAHEHEGRLGPRQVVPKVVEDPAPSAHPRPRDDDRPGVLPDLLRRLPGEGVLQKLELKRVLPVAEQAPGRGGEPLRVPLEDLGRPDGEGESR